MTTSDFFNYIPFYRHIAAIQGYTRFIEVGSYAGASCSFLANELKNQGRKIEVYAVDLWDKTDTTEGRWVFPLSKFTERIAHMGLGEIVKPIQDESHKAAELFEDKSVDFVFIDAAHDYDHVKADIEAWMPKVKPGGILSGHDYGEPCDVKKVVDELLGDRISLMGTCWYLYPIAMGKWLIIQSDGQHKGQDGWTPNWLMRECYAIHYALFQLGHEAEIWGLRHANFSLPRPDFDSYDGIFTIENYELDWLPDLSGTRRPLRLFWLIDAHWQPMAAFNSVLPRYDIILHSTRRFIETYSHQFPNQKHVYFPNGVDDRYFDRQIYPEALHRNPLIFIGGKSAPRAAAIDRMIEKAGLHYAYGVTGMDYIYAVLDAKIQFNKGLNGDINYRNWETIGLGTCLLTEYDPEMEALGFRNDQNCLFYRSVDEAVELAQMYTKDASWERVAEGGYQLSRQHSYTARVKNLIENEISHLGAANH